ncbi:MAG: agmatinase [Nitrososphaeria archaeon]
MSYKTLFLQNTGKIIEMGDPKKPIGKVFGVPFDLTSSYRAGSKFAPQAIRSAFNNIEIFSKVFNIDLEEVYIEDLGDVTISHDARTTADRVFSLWKEFLEEKVPTCMLGGEHSISYGSISALPEDVGVVIFDAHLDLRDELDGSNFTHATYFRRLLDKMDHNRFLHLGSRAACKQEWAFAKSKGLNVLEADRFPQDACKAYFFNEHKKLYFSIDMDVFDPAYAPGVGNPEPAGISPKDFLVFLKKLRQSDLVGFDIVEVCPPYDNGNTSVLAAKLMMELFCSTLV